METYRNILYVSHGTTDEATGLKQALSLARNNASPLKILILSPEFPQEFSEHWHKYEKSLVAQMELSIKATLDYLHMKDGEVNTSIELLTGTKPVVKIIQYVLQHDHDLVIKEVEPGEKQDGFKAIDMDLLRKCPSPLWLCRPIKQSRKTIQVGVAIDPESVDIAAEDLSQRMLEISRALADDCSGELHIISCWDYALEEYLRGSSWIEISEDELIKTVNMTRDKHRANLDRLIEASKVAGKYHVHHLRGKADELIPAFTKENKIDILVMGTIARTGIPGFIIGNTAENIVSKLSCSLMALKPQGFISPVKPL